jgi:hypothetical protein
MGFPANLHYDWGDAPADHAFVVWSFSLSGSRKRTWLHCGDPPMRRRLNVTLLQTPNLSSVQSAAASLRKAMVPHQDRADS